MNVQFFKMAKKKLESSQTKLDFFLLLLAVKCRVSLQTVCI